MFYILDIASYADLALSIQQKQINVIKEADWNLILQKYLSGLKIM